ncbi:unnamed protein product [Amoebophrya sp. A25]|nr:unnamed protein product [Amoebophrya sp. A25]|eukprot:GSA25T00021859001.1
MPTTTSERGLASKYVCVRLIGVHDQCFDRQLDEQDFAEQYGPNNILAVVNAEHPEKKSALPLPASVFAAWNGRYGLALQLLDHGGGFEGKSDRKFETLLKRICQQRLVTASAWHALEEQGGETLREWRNEIRDYAKRVRSHQLAEFKHSFVKSPSAEIVLAALVTTLLCRVTEVGGVSLLQVVKSRLLEAFAKEKSSATSPTTRTPDEERRIFATVFVRELWPTGTTQVKVTPISFIDRNRQHSQKKLLEEVTSSTKVVPLSEILPLARILAGGKETTNGIQRLLPSIETLDPDESEEQHLQEFFHFLRKNLPEEVWTRCFPLGGAWASIIRNLQKSHYSVTLVARGHPIGRRESSTHHQDGPKEKNNSSSSYGAAALCVVVRNALLYLKGSRTHRRFYLEQKRRLDTLELEARQYFDAWLAQSAQMPGEE